MHTRRNFLKTATMLSGAAGLLGTLPPSIQKALAIDPAKGSTYLDAEHIVVLMQENRSFDHTYGSLQGVRGFNDPRAITLPSNNPVWLQTNARGETYTPFRLNIKDTKATWIGSLPHSWTNQVDAHNNGRHDQWLEAKISGNKAFAHVPLTMGYYNREDIPFYYSLADAFTVCDQNFCSSLTGTTPNRLYLFTGTVRESHDPDTHAKVRNEDVDYDVPASWKTFPERLEENNISWKIYQNEISLDSGFEGEEDPWLSNFTDNPIEWFSQYHVRFGKSFRQYLQKLSVSLPGEIKSLKEKWASSTTAERETLQKQLDDAQEKLAQVNREIEKWSEENFDKLSPAEKNIHNKAFTTNRNDPDFRRLKTIEYNDEGTTRKMEIPAGDVLHQFRSDVEKGELPVISWLVAPENFSDHPGAPWYGAWYVSEVLDILTQDPEVWKKTIFILCYDENDGYFDHVPPFVPPDTRKRETGLASAVLNTAADHVTLEQDLRHKPREEARGSSIGLGFRVPLVIVSPWSRGGAVCSEVFDHTSIIQLMENFLTHKTGKEIRETNITGWRRTVCGDLSSVFKPYNGEKTKLPPFLDKTAFVESIHKAQFKKDPFSNNALTAEEIGRIHDSGHASALLPRQEEGIRLSCAIPYQLYADGKLNPASRKFEVKFRCDNEIFGPKTAGAPFNVYAHGKDVYRTWAYAVVAGDQLQDEWALSDFPGNEYFLRVYGPNGFFREFKGNDHDPSVEISMDYSRGRISDRMLNGNVQLRMKNTDRAKTFTVVVTDNAYKKGTHKKSLGRAGTSAESAFIDLDLSSSHGWYDFTVSVTGNETFTKRYAGHVETGKESYTDPAMGNI